MRAVVLLAMVLATAVGLAAAPRPCHMDLTVDAGVGPHGETAVELVADRLVRRGVAVTVTAEPRLRSRDRVFDWARLRPAGWASGTRPVTVFAGPATVEDELGRADPAVGEIVLAADLVDSDLFSSAVWTSVVAHELGHLAGLSHEAGGVMATGLAPEHMQLSDAMVGQLAAAWCG